LAPLLAGQGYDSIIPDAAGAASHSLSKTLAEKVGDLVEQYVKAMEKVLSGGRLTNHFADFSCNSC